jgi:hypothetical protein
MSDTDRPSEDSPPEEGRVTSVLRTTVRLSPVSMTSVSISTAPRISTTRPPNAPARKSEAVCRRGGGAFMDPVIGSVA